jgi:TRAP-type uncharacterized transport system fused permease subunit
VWLGIIWSVFQVYTAYAGLFDLLIQLPVHVAFAVALGFLTTPVPESAEQAEKFRMRRTYRGLDRVAMLRSRTSSCGRQPPPWASPCSARASSGICAGPPACGKRAVLLVGAFLLIFPGALSDAMGIACFLAVWLAQRDARRRVDVAVASRS